jgi:hypothetical protein
MDEMKRFLILMVLLASVLGMVSVSFSAREIFQGTITKIDESGITVRSDKGVDKTVTGNAGSLRIGDKVTVRDGAIIKAGNTALSPNLNPQPEPPMSTGKVNPKADGKKPVVSPLTETPTTPEQPTPPPPDKDLPSGKMK